MKSLFLLLIGSIFFGSSFSIQTFACGVCTKAPSDLERYFTAMDKLLGVLDTPPYQQGTGNQFVEDGKEIGFTTKAAIQSAGSVTMMNFVFFVHTAFLDMGAEIKTLAGTQARRRDREHLLRYDRKIMMKGLDIGQRAYVGRNISEAQLDEINEILVSELGYLELNKQSGSYVSLLKQATYEDILILYRNMNYLYKKIHQQKRFHTDLDKIGSEYNIVDDLRKAETLEKPEREGLQNFRNKVQNVVEAILLEQQQDNRGAAAQLLTFKENYTLFAAYIWQIQQDYACTIGTKNQCDTSRKATIADSRDNTKGRTADVQRSMKMFADAWARLKGALRSKDTDAIKAAQQREEALMQSYYGGDVPPERKWFVSDTAQRGFAADNPGLDNDANYGVQANMQGNIEETSSDTQAFIRRLQDRFKKKNDGSSELEESIGGAVGLSNLPKDTSQSNPNNYQSLEDKKAALNKYIEETVATRRLGQEIELQGAFAGQKRELQAAVITKTFTDIFTLQQDREQENLFGDVRSATTLFPVLSAAVWRNIELRGNKNEPSAKETSSINNSAGKICELQCSNLQGKCRYYTN